MRPIFVLDDVRVHRGQGIEDRLVGLRPLLLRFEKRGTMLEHVIPDIHDQKLRRKRLAGVPGRTHALTTAALRARHAVEQLLPREIRHLRGTKGVVFGHVLDVDVHRLERALRSLGREQHVDAGCHDVQVLGVGDVDEEPEDD